MFKLWESKVAGHPKTAMAEFLRLTDVDKKHQKRPINCRFVRSNGQYESDDPQIAPIIGVIALHKHREQYHAM